ncbi:selenocysteine-specific elongation factor [Desulfacinum hydrothermale DSM 13146]|uniref:Selenocysteine-specific elongation factor n=1 Tax=Desulfacinum hydrothermale DSM 13146 TaxID=1121390 RepID=A0A1W1XFM8_9BACT|nr:selenocysteine-specific translation elongation factor [Desulfacinum hydrothermale]SMC22574.1 selenocysteine-specific elongation factor [Desulfacinum hydrothermale DSM 13146]
MIRTVTIGIAGHVDHGKTSLVRRLTGVDTDRMPEEKRRGLTIEPGVAPLRLTSGRVLSLVDVPGHKDYLRNAVRGLAAVQGAVLVVAADDGVMPQTRDHLDILQLLGARTGMVVLSKADRVDEETLEYARLEIEDLTEGTFLEGCPIVVFSAQDGRGTPRILKELERLASRLDGGDMARPSRIWIDRVRSVAGHGTVVSGTLHCGVLRENDPLAILPAGRLTRVRSLEVHHRKVKRAQAGQRVGVALHHVTTKEVGPGMLLAQPGTVEAAPYLNVDLGMLRNATHKLFHQQRIRVHVGTACVQGRVHLLHRTCLEPGEQAIAQIRLEEAVGCLAEDRFVVSFLGDSAIAGGGRILEPTREKLRPAKAGRMLPYLHCLQRGDLEGALEHLFARSPYTPLSTTQATVAMGFRREVVSQVLQRWCQDGRLVVLEDGRYVRKRDHGNLRRKFLDTMVDILSSNPLKEWVSGEELRARVHMKLDPEWTRHLLTDLCRRGLMDDGEGGYRMPQRKRNWTPHQKEIRNAILTFARRAGLSSFAAGTFCDHHRGRFHPSEVQRILDHLAAQKHLVRLQDGRYITREALAAVEQRVRSWIQAKGALRLSDCPQALGYGRTRAVAVLEHLDAMGVTIRLDDRRLLAKDHAEAFWRKAGTDSVSP